ncbi:MAG: peptide chain release factor 2 [bacterium]|nr:peptide chain release factor 2 [bacterium]
MKRKNSGGHFDIAQKSEKKDLLEKESLDESFWNDSKHAKAVMKEFETLKSQIKSYQNLESAVEDVQVLLEFFEEDSSEANQQELETAIKVTQDKLTDLQLKKMLSGQLDQNSAYLLINAGAGGTESCDWADMLCRMYLRYAERHGHTASIIDYTEGDGAGYRNVTIQIDGDFAYGYLKAENGVHRLVRVSPFDANNRRHTSFCSVFVYAQVDDDIDIEVTEDDLIFEAIRASGAGGQKVNKTSSAVRLTHKPSGIVVRCQSERSQHQNRVSAMKMLKARLYEKELEKKNKEKQKVEDSKMDIGWGSQIRSYVLHPYQMIKDHRTSIDSGQTGKVLDGEIDEFIKEYLLRYG